MKNIPDTLINPLMTKFNITREEAEKRLQLLSKSSLIQNRDSQSERLIDAFLAQESKVLEQTVAFDVCFNQCLSDTELIKQYDRLRTKANMANTLKLIERGNLNRKEERECEKQFTMFEKFVREYVFSRLENSPLQQINNPTQ